MSPIDPSLPPNPAPSKAQSRKVINLAEAVAAMSQIPVLDIVKRRMYDEWLGGLRPRKLRDNYRTGAGKPLTVDEIDVVLRAHAKADRRRAQRTPITERRSA
jgi:hypothetical protein